MDVRRPLKYYVPFSFGGDPSLSTWLSSTPSWRKAFRHLFPLLSLPGTPSRMNLLRALSAVQTEKDQPCRDHFVLPETLLLYICESIEWDFLILPLRVQFRAPPLPDRPQPRSSPLHHQTTNIYTNTLIMKEKQKM